CGPCSEIHYDLGPAASTLGHPDCPFPCPQDCGRYVELWNLVFMQFNRDEQGNMTPLPRPSIDTGAGLERLAAVLQGKISNYDTDLFRPLIEEAAGLANVEYGANHDTDVSLRIIGDHARAATFLISDGVLPSNEGRGYVLRLIMRRALYHGQTLGLNEPFLYKMAGHVVQMMKDAYPELVETEHHVVKAIKIEEERYAHTTRVGLERLESTPIVLRSGEELPLRLARPLQRIIAERPHDEELSSRWQRRAGSWNTTDEERTAFEEFARTWNSRDRFYKLFDAVSALLPAEARKKDWMGHFKMAVGQEASNISLINSYVRAMWRLREREEVASSPLLRDAADLLMRRFPPQGTPAWIPGDELFKLHDTFGLRPDFIEDIVKVYGFAVDRAGYEAEMQKQRERARASWVAIEKKLALPAYLKLSGSHKSEFLGYEETRASGCRVVAILPRGIDQILPEVLPGKGPVELEVVLDKTPFYAEAGGQVGDRGWFTVNGERAARVEDTYSPVTGIIAHRVRWAWPPPQFKLRIGDIISAEVDEDLRRATMRNHTATHLLHAALRKTLGTHVKQAGSLVAPDRLRFDFTHYAALDEQDLRDIEDLVNEHILKNEVVATEEKDRDSAVAGGATALFGEKYADKVRVLSINDFSKELCGGTHVQRTGDIGLFKIVSESSVAAGTRRIEAVTGKAVLEHMRLIMSAFQEQQGRALKKRPRQISLGETARAVLGGSDPLTRRLRELEGKVKKLESQQMKQAADQARQLLGGIKKAPADSAAGSWKDEARQSVGVDIIVRGVRVVVARVEVTDRSAMRQMVDDLRAKLQSGVIVLGSVS
ncbi:MAG: alanine--tRNA ligase-related protein, partial [Terriglobia bacterium]